MSSGGVGGKKANGVASAPIPATFRKVVQSLKEIVNCPDQEIYAMLKECNMDPSEAVHRLLSQDTFHEVKSKREKKKENKETLEPKSRGVSSSSSHGAKGGFDCGGRISSTQFSSNDYGLTRGKPVHKKENGAASVLTSSILGSGIAANNVDRRSTSLSNSFSTDNTIQAEGIADGTYLPSQPSSGFQHNWSGLPGHVSMADIVKMGRPHGKASSTTIVATDTSYISHNAVMSNTSHYNAKPPPTTILPSESYQEIHSSQDPVSKVSEVSQEPGIIAGQNISHDDYSLADQLPSGNESTVSETSGASAIYADPTTLHFDGLSLHLSPNLDETHVLEGNVNDESLPADSFRSASVSDRQIQLDNSGGASFLDDCSSKNMTSYQSQSHAVEDYEVEDVNVEMSSANLQQLSLFKEELAPSDEDKPAVIFPSHFQVTNADCPQLSFGSLESGISAKFSGSFWSNTLKNNLKAASVATDASPIDLSDDRNPENCDNEQLRSTFSENAAPKTGAIAGNYETHLTPGSEAMRDDSQDAAHGLQYSFPSISDYAFPSTTHPNAATYTYAEGNSQMQNIAPFSSIMQPYTNSLPSNFLGSTVPPVREVDLHFSSLLENRSMPTKYSTAVSSVSGPTITLPEAVEPVIFSSPQETTSTMPSTSIPTGPSLPQHLPVHPFSQSTLPLGHFANMISYPFLPQSYTYLPSAAFQQSYTGNGAFHQSLGPVHSADIKYPLPQYKNSVSVTSLSQSPVVASGYGGFQSSTDIPGNFALHPSASASTIIGYDNALSTQFKEGNRYVPPQQSEWVQGAGSRTMTALPANTYYSFQGQNQHNGFRQGQQPSSFVAMGYSNFHHSLAGVSQERQQNPSEGNLNGTQGPPSQQSHQMWQHSY